MSPKRGDRAAPPPAGDEWDVRFACSQAAKGWDDLAGQAAANLATAWRLLRTDPAPAVRTDRHHRLKGTLACGRHRGQELERWQIEVTGAGRIWFLVDAAHRTVWIDHAGTGHPKATD